MIDKVIEKGFTKTKGVDYNTLPLHLYLADIQKWFRDEHGINITIMDDGGLSWAYTIQALHPQSSFHGFFESQYTHDTYETALIYGINKARELL